MTLDFESRKELDEFVGEWTPADEQYYGGIASVHESDIAGEGDTN